MSDTTPARREFLLKHWEGFRTEMNDNVARYVELERYALITTAAIWTWLAGVTDGGWDPILAWLPLVLNVFFTIRGYGLILRAREIGDHLKKAEKYFGVPAQLALEQNTKEVSFKTVSIWGFWPLLLLATAVLPFLYEVGVRGRIWPA